MTRELTLLRHANQLRQLHWPGSEEADDLEFRTIEYSGEAGEVSDAVKKLLRFDRGIAGNGGKTRADLLQDIADEIGDVLISVDLVADALGIDLREAIITKFNKTSAKNGIPVMIEPFTMTTTVFPDMAAAMEAYTRL